MPKGLLQEKFQVTSDNERKENHGWESFESARRTKGTTQGVLNDLPPGMDITNQINSDQPSMPLSMAGQTDESNAVTISNVRKGWIKRDFSPVDDMYTNEHVEEFYGEATGKDDGGDKITGFIERNNYCDRT